MKLLPIILIALLIQPVLAANAKPDPKPAPKPAVNDEVRKLLSRHVTTAIYDGIRFQPCRHRTAQCPNQCTHAGQVATFTITQYLEYKKTGKYGDPKSKTFRVMTEDQLGNAKVPEAILKSLKSLKKGDAVQLSWNHDYVTKNRSSYPVRPITKLVKGLAKPE